MEGHDRVTGIDLNLIKIGDEVDARDGRGERFRGVVGGGEKSRYIQAGEIYVFAWLNTNGEWEPTNDFTVIGHIPAMF